MNLTVVKFSFSSVIDAIVSQSLYNSFNYKVNLWAVCNLCSVCLGRWSTSGARWSCLDLLWCQSLQKPVSDIYIYIYAFSRRFYPKRLSVFRLYIFFISMRVPWELNPQPFVLLTQCSTTEPQEHKYMAFTTSLDATPWRQAIYLSWDDTHTSVFIGQLFPFQSAIYTQDPKFTFHSIFLGTFC